MVSGELSLAFLPVVLPAPLPAGLLVNLLSGAEDGSRDGEAVREDGARAGTSPTVAVVVLGAIDEPIVNSLSEWLVDTSPPLDMDDDRELILFSLSSVSTWALVAEAPWDGEACPLPPRAGVMDVSNSMISSLIECRGVTKGSLVSGLVVRAGPVSLVPSLGLPLSGADSSLTSSELDWRLNETEDELEVESRGLPLVSLTSPLVLPSS